MKELEKKLRALQKDGYEQVTIQQMLNWIYEIRRENRVRDIEKRKANDPLNE